MRVIGTAGHVDHGKSTLVAALTGIHPDRLKEEQEREMTIDLGFAWLTLPDGEEIGIVDVPGHRDFIENMLAGVGGIDAALLVIAADEGIMPQTREHLSILDLLQIRAGIVVLTKIDLVDDPAWLDLVEGDIRNVLRGTLLQDAPILRVSARTRAGFPELLQTLSLVLQNAPTRPNLGRPRLPVDRVFSIAGFGTVVTGTLSDGKLATGEEVEILPSGLRGRIRGLQTHKKKEETAVPGSRTAVNISGLDVEQIQRGEVLTHPGQYRATQRLDLIFRLLPNVSASLRHHTEVKLFIGTSETIADVRLLGAETLNPGETGWLQLELRTPVVAVRGDRYILRRPSPGETLGGGTVVDPQPQARHKRFDKAVLRALDALAQGSPAEVLLQAALALGPVPVKDVIAHSRLEGPAAELALKELFDSGQLVKLDDGPWTMDSVVLAASQWTKLKESVVATLVAYHGLYPLRRGMPREELKSRLKLAPRLFNLVLPKMAAEGVLTEGPKWAALPGHIVRFSPFQQVKVDKLMALFAAAPYAPPSVKECQAEVGEDIFSALREFGDLVAISEEVVFHKTDYETMVEKIRQALQQKRQISLAEVRDLLNTSRKYAQALLEHLDAIGVTVRDGDFRRLRT
ncbi:MAG: selenocysteine-specific translation elongation factor [Anaerolineales bacterium]|nr:selenocysteine-specific translation elongation factor [Anaerolineales bacterium]